MTKVRVMTKTHLELLDRGATNGEIVRDKVSVSPGVVTIMGLKITLRYCFESGRLARVDCEILERVDYSK